MRAHVKERLIDTLSSRYKEGQAKSGKKVRKLFSGLVTLKGGSKTLTNRKNATERKGG